MNPSRPFILRPIATSLLMVAVLLAGLVAYKQLPVSALPEVDYPTMQVQTFLPGASPEVMTSSVTAPLERQLGQIPGLNQMTSISSYGSSIITLQFVLNLNIDVAEQEVQAAINGAGTFLPPNLPNPPIYSKSNPADAPILTIALTSDTLPLAQVEDFADTMMAQKISQLSGVGLVSISGGQRPAVRVQANPSELASYGMSLEDLRTALSQANVDQAKGFFDGAHQAYTIGDNDQLTTSADYKPLIVAYRNGNPVRLQDVATVVDGAENVDQAAWANTRPAVILNIQRQPGANIISVVNEVKELLPRLESSLPSAVHVTVLTDRTTTIRASVADVQLELMLTVLLVVLVIFAFLRSISATIIPSIVVPLALVGTFAFMYLLGFSLDNLSLMALTISTGFVVDDAIVMIENISRYIEEGVPPLQAALRGSEQIGFTIISITFSLIAVLIPLLFMGDVVGRLFREFALTLTVTIVMSAFVSLTLTPMMCARLLRRRASAGTSWLYRTSERGLQAMVHFYQRTLDVVLNHQFATLVVTVGTLVLTVVLYIVIPKGFFPVQDTGEILGISEGPQNVSFAAMSQRQQALAKVILQDPAVANLSSFIGIDGTNTTLNNGRLQINLKPLGNGPGERGYVNASEVIRRLEPAVAKVPGIALYLQPVQDLSVEDRISRTQFQYSVEDADAAELAQWVPKLLDKMRAMPELRDVASDSQDNGLQTMVTVNRDEASRLGLIPSTIDNTLYDAFGQRQVSTIFTQQNQYHVILEVDPKYQLDPQSLKEIYVDAGSSGAFGSSAIGTTAAGSVSSTATLSGVSTARGNEVPLSAFTTVQTKSAPLTINHQGQFPVVTLSFNLAPGASLGQAVNAIHAAEQEIGLPPSVQPSFQGTAAAFINSLANEPILILAALIAVYIVLGVLYESYIHPITILSTLPSAGVGALLALMLFHIEFSIIALIGLILLIGIVQKNAILMIDFALEAERKEHRPPLEAIREACLLRFRPILMTTLAAMMGGIPLALGRGTGSELRRPLGIAIVGGLLLSQVLTLYTTPVVYLAFDWLSRKLRRPAIAASLEPST
ncbi:MAG: acriflavine resistance protein B [Acidobacteria bacterium]|nr:MAG: acriflavine resistance protein B [Acidobacteriota bacterium]